jgi:hypothetical protein
VLVLGAACLVPVLGAGARCRCSVRVLVPVLGARCPVLAWFRFCAVGGCQWFSDSLAAPWYVSNE